MQQPIEVGKFRFYTLVRFIIFVIYNNRLRIYYILFQKIV